MNIINFKIFNLGTNIENSVKQNIDIVFTNIIAIMLGFVFISFSIKNFIEADYLLAFVLLGQSLSYSLILLFNYFKKDRLSIWVLLGLITLHLYLGMFLFGPEQRSEGIFLAILLFSVLVLKSGKFKNLYLISIVVSYFVIYFITQFIDPMYSHKVTFGTNMLIIAISLLCIGILSYIWNRHNINIQEKNEQLISDIKDKNERLEKFIFLASHDLKTPIRTIVSFNELIKIDIAKQEYQDLGTYANLSLNAGKKMYKLIDDIVSYAKIDEVDQTFELVFLKELINEIKEELDIDFPNSNIINQVDAKVKGIKIQLQSLFKNLMENGLKYNESEIRSLKLSSYETDKNLIVLIEDNGIGIPEKHRDYVFGMFKRLHVDDKYEGTGIGLALCKQIMDLHNGHIEIETSISGGTIFKLKLKKIPMA